MNPPVSTIGPQPTAVSNSTDYKYSTQYLVPTFNGLVAQIGLSVAISIVCICIFEYNRRKKTLEYLYSPRCHLSVHPSPPVSRQFLGWIMQTIRIPEEFYISKVGLDAVMYLRFIKMCLQFCLFNATIVGAILLPIHYYAEGGVNEVPRISISNVPNESNLLWAHVFFTYLITISWMFLLFKNYWQWMDLRREYTLQRIRQGEIAERSIFISRLPSDLRSDEALRRYFESLKMGPVESATVVQHCGSLSQKIDRRESALNMLEKAHIELACSVLDSIKAGQFPMDSANNLATLTDKSLIHPHAATTTVDDVTFQRMVLDLFSDRKQYNKTRKSVFAKRLEISSRTSTILNKPATTVDQGPETPTLTVTVHPPDMIDIVAQQDLEEGSVVDEPQQSSHNPDWTIWDVLGALDRQSLDPFRPTRPEKRFKGGRRVDSIDYSVKKYNRLDKKVQDLRDGSSRFKATSYGFVTFRHHLSAQLCAQSKIDSRPQGISVCLAMEPRDVLWSNLTASFRNRFTRSVAVNLSIWTLILFWIFPTSSFLILTSLGELSERFTFLKPIVETSPLIQSLLQNVLPIVFVSIFLALAPVIILAISKQELPVSHSALEENVLRRFYYFLCFSILFVFVIGTAILKSIIALIQQETNIFTLLANTLPSSSTFFVFYIVFNTCAHFLELSQVWAQLVIHIVATARKFTRTPRSLQRATVPWSFQYYYYYPQNILAFVITLIYSTISPLVLLAAVFYFASALLVFKYQFAYCYVRKYENSGRHFRYVFQYTSDGLIIFQVTMIGVLWLKEALIGGFFIVALLGFTIYFKILCSNLFKSRTKYLPLDTGLRNFDSEPSLLAGEEGIDTCAASSAISVQTSAMAPNLQRRPMTNSGKASGVTSCHASSTDLGDNGPSSGDMTCLEQPSTLSRLRVAAGQSDRYKKLVHIDSAEDVSIEKQATGNSECKGDSQRSSHLHIATTQDQSTAGTNVSSDCSVHSSEASSECEALPSVAVAPEGSAAYSGFLAENGYFTSTLGPSPPIHIHPTIAPHFEHMSSRIVYQDQTSDYETYMHPALLRPLHRKLWLPRNPLYEHWDLDNTVEIDFAFSSSDKSSKVQLRVQAAEDLAESSRFGHPENPVRRNTVVSNFEETVGVTSAALASSNWQGCLEDPNLGVGENAHHRRRATLGSLDTRAVVSEAQGRINYPLNYLTRSPPALTQSMASARPFIPTYAANLCAEPTTELPPLLERDLKRRLSMPLERASTNLRRPGVSPIVTVETRRTLSHDTSISHQKPAATSARVDVPAPNRARTLGSTAVVHSSHHRSMSGIGPGPGSSLHKTQPKNTRGFLNMMFGRYEDEDIQEEGEERPQFGYETGGMWLSRRRSRGHENDDDDDDDEEEEDNVEATVREKGKGRWFQQRHVGTGQPAIGDSECVQGLEELQLGHLSNISPVATDKMQS